MGQRHGTMEGAAWTDCVCCAPFVVSPETKSPKPHCATWDFFVILFTNEWEILSDDCKLLATMKPCGTPIQADEDEFIVRDGNVITWYDKNGKNVGSHELTAEEIEYLDKK